MTSSPSPAIQRLGQILVSEGLLRDSDVGTLLELQANRNRPIGQLAEEHFGIDARAIETAWGRQYAQGAERVDPMGQRVESRAIEAIDRRQAWQFALLPMRFEGRDLVVATTEGNVPRALRFVSRQLCHPCYLVLAEPEILGQALAYYYPMAGLDGGFLAARAIVRG